MPGIEAEVGHTGRRPGRAAAAAPRSTPAAAGAGYMRARSHELLDLDACPILVPALRNGAPGIARALHAVGRRQRDRLHRHAHRPRRHRAQRAQAHAAKAGADGAEPETGAAVAQRRAGAAVTAAARCAWARALSNCPSAAFCKPQQLAEETLADLVLKTIGPVKAVADLFCGVGPFALRLAQTSRVFAADSDKPATAALAKAVNFTQGLKPVTTLARDLFRDPLAPVELQPYDAVVFDPPRAGAEAQAKGTGPLQGQDRRRRLLRTQDLCPGCSHPDRGRYYAEARPRGSIRLVRPCRGGGSIPAVRTRTTHAERLGEGFFDPVQAGGSSRSTSCASATSAGPRAVGLDALSDARMDRAFRPLRAAARQPAAAAGAALSRPPVPQCTTPTSATGAASCSRSCATRRRAACSTSAPRASGQTPWSRGGDGRLTLKGGVREMLATEMLEALGVDTSQDLLA